MVSFCVSGAWQRGRTRIYENGYLSKDIHCWAIVFGDGQLGAICSKNGRLSLASKDTGFSEMAPETFKAFGTAVGAAFAEAMGSREVTEALRIGGKVVKDRLGDDIPASSTPATGGTE